jgi:hypothetical protein
LIRCARWRLASWISAPAQFQRGEVFELARQIDATRLQGGTQSIEIVAK